MSEPATDVPYSEWEASVEAYFTGDALWQLRVYRRAMYLGDLAELDATRLHRDGRLQGVSAQLERAAGSVAANISEGFSRRSSADRTRQYEYALGSARETRDWYRRARRLLGTTMTQHRLREATIIVQMLNRLISAERSKQ